MCGGRCVRCVSYAVWCSGRCGVWCGGRCVTCELCCVVCHEVWCEDGMVKMFLCLHAKYTQCQLCGVNIP